MECLHYLILRLTINYGYQDSAVLVYRQINRSMEQNGEFKNTPIRTQLINFDQGAKDGRTDGLFNKWCEKN